MNLRDLTRPDGRLCRQGRRSRRGHPSGRDHRTYPYPLGSGRTGSRIRAAVERAAKVASPHSLIVGDFSLGDVRHGRARLIVTSISLGKPEAL